MPNIETHELRYFDNAGTFHAVLQIWVRMPATGVSVIVSAEEIEVDPAQVPERPTRPA